MKSDALSLYNIIGSNIKEKRKDSGYTQKQFAEMFNVSFSTMAHYEEGVNKIPLELLIKIADYYEISMDNILGRKDYSKKSHRKSNSDFDIESFTEKVSKLSVGSQKALDEIVNHMK